MVACVVNLEVFRIFEVCVHHIQPKFLVRHWSLLFARFAKNYLVSVIYLLLS